MPGTLTHSVGWILQKLLIDLGLGTEPSANDNWPVFENLEHNSPDEVITCYDTEMVKQGRTMTDGEVQGREGFLIRVRSRTHRSGWTKANSIAITLDQSVLDQLVTVETTSYVVKTITRISGPLSLNKDKPATRRNLFTINGSASVRQV